MSQKRYNLYKFHIGFNLTANNSIYFPDFRQYDFKFRVTKHVEQIRKRAWQEIFGDCLGWSGFCLHLIQSIYWSC